MARRVPRSLAEAAPELARVLARNVILTPSRFAVADIRCTSVKIPMRDGVCLATDVYLPPVVPAPSIAMRTPYGRGADAYAGLFLSFARRGYVVISQDCRGTGDSEPDSWDYYMYEPEDSYDLVEWVRSQSWFDGFLGACGGSYVGQTQWQMGLHPCMSTLVPDVSGLGIAINTAHPHMFANAYARSVGKGKDKVAVPYFVLEAQLLEETWRTGYFNEPLQMPFPEVLLSDYPQLRALSRAQARQWLWEQYCAWSCAERAGFVKRALGIDSVTAVHVESLSTIFGHRISHDAHTLPHPRPADLCRSFHAPVLLRTGWYDWGLNDALATWELLMRAAPESMRCRCRLFIAPSAHNMPGYHEGMAEHPELHHAYTATTTAEMLLRWYEAVRTDLASWPTVIYYLMGANEWCAAECWPPSDSHEQSLYLRAGGELTSEPPREDATPDRYSYDPDAPTPTGGGSIVSYVYPPGSVEISDVQRRPDVLTYTGARLERDLDVAGPLRVVLYASSSAIDTDFVARLSDVFPDGRAIQLQNGVLRTRYRNLSGEPELLEPGRIYRFEIDLWATANRFKAGHRVRLDISSADFPRFDRNTNRGGRPGAPICAQQAIFHDRNHPSQLILNVVAQAKSDERTEA